MFIQQESKIKFFKISYVKLAVPHSIAIFSSENNLAGCFERCETVDSDYFNLREKKGL